MKRKTKNIRTNLAVSEIIGTMLMLVIATSSFSVVYYQVVSAPTPTPAPIVEISGMIDDNQVIVTHHGGVPLDLDTELVLNVGGIQKSFKVRDFLDSKSKEDGVWGLSEKVVFPLEYDFDYSVFDDLDISVIDRASNSLLMTGIARVTPTCDLGIMMTVSTLTPREFDNVEFTITVTNYGNINASGVVIEFLLPEGLTYYSSIMDQGSYDSGVGIWDLGQVLKGESVELTVIATVGDVIDMEPMQLVMLLDGSGSIEPANWTMMLNGLSAAVKNESRFPHNGNIEFTVIQFGGKTPAYAQLEIGPIVVTESNVDSVLDEIQKIIQIGEKTPTSCSVYMAADVLKDSDMFDPDIRQVILLVTDGNPTHSCADDGDYIDKSDKTDGPKESVVVARDYLVDLLDLNIYSDSFNALSIELEGDGHTKDLVSRVVWPQPGYETVGFSEEYFSYRGWVRNVKSWEDFADSINESFEIIFCQFPVEVSVKSTAFIDPKDVNDESYIILKPLPKFASIIEEV